MSAAIPSRRNMLFSVAAGGAWLVADQAGAARTDVPSPAKFRYCFNTATIYPGDGVAPLASVIEQLRSIGFYGVLSLELFNRDYWRQDPALVARTGLEKMKQVVAASPG